MVLMLALSISVANAADYTITVSNACNGETYYAYKLFDVTAQQNISAYAYTFTSSNYQSASADDATIDGTIKALETAGYITVTRRGTSNVYNVAATSTFDANIADFMMTRFRNNKLPATTSANASATASNSTAQLNIGSNYGYYFITTTQGTMVIADTIATGSSSLTVNNKNETPTVEKTVGADYNDLKPNGHETLGISYADHPYFKVKIHLTKGLVNFSLHDQMETGLKLNATSSITVFKTADLSTSQQVASTNYTLTTDSATEKTYFDIAFNQDYLDTIGDAGADIYVVYQATLTEDAVDKRSHLNTATITWGHDPHTASDTATVTTAEIKLLKKGDNGEALNGVTFMVYKDDDMTNPLKFVLLETSGVNKNVYRLDTSSSGVTEVSTKPKNNTSGAFVDQDGVLYLKLLSPGVYHFVETSTLDGYQLMTNAYDVTITSTDTVVTATVTNHTGTRLPSTGGVGSKIFITVGLLTMLATGVILAANRLMKKEDLFD